MEWKKIYNIKNQQTWQYRVNELISKIWLYICKLKFNTFVINCSFSWLDSTSTATFLLFQQIKSFIFFLIFSTFFLYEQKENLWKRSVYGEQQIFFPFKYLCLVIQTHLIISGEETWRAENMRRFYLFTFCTSFF